MIVTLNAAIHVAAFFLASERAGDGLFAQESLFDAGATPAQQLVVLWKAPKTADQGGVFLGCCQRRQQCVATALRRFVGQPAKCRQRLFLDGRRFAARQRQVIEQPFQRAQCGVGALLQALQR